MKFNAVEVKRKVMNVRIDPSDPSDMAIISSLQEIVTNQPTPKKDQEEGFNFLVNLLCEFNDLRA
tara:strand:+ start:913 stop:1107 length:195 start_codon:yes stop_codon:yes gene_type:complete